MFKNMDISTKGLTRFHGFAQNCKYNNIIIATFIVGYFLNYIREFKYIWLCLYFTQDKDMFL